ncbi:MAG: type II secretion system protein [bacterium]|nr:type II secretion system protein [bacterium]
MYRHFQKNKYRSEPKLRVASYGSQMRGFSLIESLVVTSIVAIAAVGVLGSMRSTQSHMRLEEGQASVIRAFELARSRAATGAGSDDHGVYVDGDTLTVFEGPTYTGDGEVIMLPASVTTDQVGTTIVFERLSAHASGSADIEVSDTSGEKAEVQVTADGAIIPN